MVIPNWRTIIETLNSKTSEEEYRLLVENFENGDTNEKFQSLYKFVSEKQVVPRYRKEAKKSAPVSKRYRERGNQAFARNRDTDALKLYTESVAYAPDDSEELALAYANRSAVLLGMGKFTSALVDVNRALKKGYPEPLRPKLLTRKRRCLTKIESLDDEKKYVNLVATVAPTVGPIDVLGSGTIYEYADLSDVNLSWKSRPPEADFKNEKFPNVSTKLKFAKNEWAGRHIIAAEDISPGELLMTERPWTAVLFFDSYRTYCYHCFVKCSSMIPCENCSLVMFCGENCRDLATNLYHKMECEMLPSLLTFDEQKLELVAVRVLLQVSRQGQDLEQLANHTVFRNPFYKIDDLELGRSYSAVDDYLCVHSLEDNLDRLPLSRKLERTFMAVFLLQLLKQFNFFSRTSAAKIARITSPESSSCHLTSTELYAGVFLLKVILAAETNGHYLSDMSSKMNRRLGAAIYPLVSYVNHSCDANILKVTYKNQMALYASQPIFSGEQIFLDYGSSYLTTSREERQSYLQNEYYFTCQCDPCRHDWPRMTELPFENPTFVCDEVDLRKLRILSSRFKKLISLNPTIGLLEKESDFLSEYMIFLRRNVRKPWMEYANCQEIVKCTLLKIPLIIESNPGNVEITLENGTTIEGSYVVIRGERSSLLLISESFAACVHALLTDSLPLTQICPRIQIDALTDEKLTVNEFLQKSYNLAAELQHLAKPALIHFENSVRYVQIGKVSLQKQLRGGVEFVDEIPRNVSRKILRKQLRERWTLKRKSKL